MLYEPYSIVLAMNRAGAEEARKKLPELIHRAERDGTVTIVTKRGRPCAAIVPLSHLKRGQAPKLTELRDSASGCYGDIAEYVDSSRRAW